MRIVHILHQFLPETFGGVEIYVFDLATAQKRAGHDVLIISGTMKSGRPGERRRSVHDGLDVIHLHRSDVYFDSWDKGYFPPVADAVVDELHAFSPDVVHIHHWIRLSHDLVRVTKSLGIPTVVSLHDFATSCPRCFRMRPDETPCFRPLSVASCLDCVPRRPWQSDADTADAIDFFRKNSIDELSGADAVLCATTTLRDIVTDSLGIAKDRFRVIPLAYAPRFGGAVTRRATDAFRFGYWGTITHRKGVHLLIDAFRDVVARRPERISALEIFGKFDLPERETSLRKLAEHLPVRFHGRFEYRDLVTTGLSAAVFPSICIETYGIVMDEALELGLETIVPDVGAPAERAGKTAKTFRINDKNDLVRAMLDVLDGDAPNDAARTSAAPPMSEADHGREVIATYCAAIASPRVPSLPILGEKERLRHLLRKFDAQFARLIAQEGEGTP